MPVYKLATPSFDEHSIIVRCSCHDTEHSAELAYFDNPDEWEVTFSFRLCSYDGVLRRVWRAIKYALGYKCRYGDWDTILVGVEAAREIVDFFQEYIHSRERQREAKTLPCTE